MPSESICDRRPVPEFYRSVVELTVGDATLDWQPAEVADLVGRLIAAT